MAVRHLSQSVPSIEIRRAGRRRFHPTAAEKYAPAKGAPVRGRFSDCRRSPADRKERLWFAQALAIVTLFYSTVRLRFGEFWDALPLVVLSIAI